MKKVEIELTRHNVTPGQFLSYVRSMLTRKGIRDIASDLDLNYWAAGNDLNFYYHDDASKPCKAERSISKPYEMQTYVRNWDDTLYNEIVEFQFDSDGKGFGYYYLCNITNDETETTNNNDKKEMEETTMKTTTTNKTGYDVSKLSDAMRIREASGEVTFHAPRGNDKTGIIPCWNLLPVVTCKGLCPGCYAVKNVFRRGYNVETSSVLKAWTDNTILAKTDLEGLYDKLDEYFSSMAAPRYFRIHASGDFFSKAYAYMWFRIAQNHPETRFLAFTKQFDNVRGIPFHKLDNFSLVLSAWPGKPIPDDLRNIYSVAWMQDGTEDRIPEKVFECPGNCQNCGACWGLAKDKRDVCFHKH